MSDMTCLLDAAAGGDRKAAAEFLPLVYDELRALAAACMAAEAPGQTLQATALVHEAYVRLVDTDTVPHWNSRGHFFAAAAEAMRRILVESARRKKRIKHGGTRQRAELEDYPAPSADEDLIALDEALQRLAAEDPIAARVLELHRFAGLGHKHRQASDALAAGPALAIAVQAILRFGSGHGRL
jgi:RNA polymerase sigma factor (TIGR02999 family)